MDLFPPTDQQRAVIDHRGSNLLIFAGPGTGKTETLARRFASLVADDAVRPNQILVVTFSRRAAGEMRQRILLRLGQRLGSRLAVSELFVKTFHSFCGRLLDGESRAARRRLLTPVRERLLWRAVMKPGALALESFSDDVLNSAQFATDCLNLLAHLKGRGLDARSLRQIADDKRLQDIATIFEAMEKARAALKLRDFRDLVIEAVRALAEPANPAINWLRLTGFRHVLVDEFQDSDPIDLQLLQQMAQVIEPTPCFCFVGDVNQSIYRFRGASPSNVANAQRLFQCETLPLHDNRRSAQAILDVANADGQLDIQSLTHAADPHKPGSVALLRPRSVDDEARAVCEAISEQIAQGVAPRDIAVLLRQSYPHRELMSACLRSAGLPLAALPAAGFQEDTLIDAAVTGLRLLADPSNETLWRRLLVNPIIGYRAVDVRNAFDIARRASNGDMQAALRASPPFGRRPVAWFLESWQSCMHAYQSGDPLRVLRSLIAKLDLLWPVRETNAPAGFDKAASPLRLQALLSAAEDYAETVADGERLAQDLPAEFVARLDETIGLLSDQLEPPASSADGIRVMSIHAAKGLEFECVAIPQLIDGILPAAERPNRLLTARAVERLRRKDVEIFADREAALKEEHALWYVALTRAKTAVIVSAPQFDDDGVEQQVSPFTTPIAAHEQRPVQITARNPQPAVNGYAAKTGAQQMTLDLKGADSSRDSQPVRGGGINLELLALSPTRITDFIVCPRRFYYAHVLKLERDDEEVTQHGTILHAVLKRFHERESNFEHIENAGQAAHRYAGMLRELSIQEVRGAYQGLAQDSPLARFELANLDARLRMYARWLAAEASEQPFRVLACEQGVVSSLEGVEVRGEVDRIDRLHRGGLVIRDYKSGSQKGRLAGAVRKAFAQMDAGADIFGDAPAGLNVQAILYVAGVQAKFQEPVRRLDYLYFRGTGGQSNELLCDQTSIVDHDPAGEHQISRADVARVERDVAAHIAQLCNAGSALEFATAKQDTVCMFCDYTSICPGAQAAGGW